MFQLWKCCVEGWDLQVFFTKDSVIYWVFIPETHCSPEGCASLFWGFPELLPREFSTILTAWAGCGCLASCWNSWILTIQPHVITSKVSDSHSFLQIFNIYLDAAFVLPLKIWPYWLYFSLLEGPYPRQLWDSFCAISSWFFVSFLMVFCAFPLGFGVWVPPRAPCRGWVLFQPAALQCCCISAGFLSSLSSLGLLPEWEQPDEVPAAQKCNVFFLLLVLEPEPGTRSQSCRAFVGGCIQGERTSSQLCCSCLWVEELKGLRAGMGQTLGVCPHLCPAPLPFAFVVCGVSHASKTLCLTQNNQRNWTFRNLFCAWWKYF